MAKEMIFSSAKKTVYRDGDTAIKEFCEGFPKAEVLNEHYVMQEWRPSKRSMFQRF